MNRIAKPEQIIDLKSGLLKAGDFITAEKKLKQLEGVFKDEQARQAMDQELHIYTVQAHLPEEENTPGGSRYCLLHWYGCGQGERRCNAA